MVTEKDGEWWQGRTNTKGQKKIWWIWEQQGVGQKMMTGLHNHQGVSEIPQTDDVIYEPPLMPYAMQSFHSLCPLICGLSWPWHRPDTWISSPQPPEPLVNEWRFAKNFSTLPFIKPNDERKWNFQSVYSSLCFRTSYILYKLQCNISCGGHAVFSIGHISLFTEVKCWLCTFSTSYSPEAALEAQFFITKCTSL